AEQLERPSRMQLMLQSLLTERFTLIVRQERREQPMYALVVARPDRRLGSALRESAIDCRTETARSPQNVGKGPAEHPDQSSCGIRMGLGSLVAGGATMWQIARTLSNLMDRTVEDRTGLTGSFDATLKWTPDQSTPGLAEKAKYVPTIDRDGPSIFTALQEQLGLK